MKTGRVLVIAAGLVLSVSCSRTPPESLSKLSEEFVFTWLANSPVAATQAGYHKHGSVELDTLLDDYSPESLDRQRRWLRDFRLRLQRAAGVRPLGADDRADYEIMQDGISLLLLELDDIRSWQRNPTLYVELIGNGLFTPYSLEYSDPETRFQHIIARLHRVPALLAQARQNLAGAPELWTTVAMDENEGNISLIKNTLANAVPAPLRASYTAAALPAVEALRGFNAYLKDVLLKRGRDWRLGPDLYRRKFRYALSTDRSPDRVFAEATQEIQRTTDQMYELARPLYRGPAVPGSAEGRVQVIRSVLSQIAARHSDPQTYFSDARRDLEEATEFVRSSGVVPLPSRSNLQVIETPEFLRGIYSVGGFNSAPPLEPHLGAFYWLTPIPTNWPAERTESKLREYNYYGLKLLTIHEAMPGHYVQLEYANDVQPRMRRLLRSVFGNGPYIEGWAVYATEMLLDAGYLQSSPELRLTFLKQQLRVFANAVLDIGLHTRGMTDDAALELMTEKAFQEQEEAAGKLKRAKLSSAQLPTYFVGWRDWRRIRDEREARDGFVAREFHKQALAAGPVPLAQLNELLKD